MNATLPPILSRTPPALALWIFPTSSNVSSSSLLGMPSSLCSHCLPGSSYSFYSCAILPTPMSPSALHTPPSEHLSHALHLHVPTARRLCVTAASTVECSISIQGSSNEYGSIYPTIPSCFWVQIEQGCWVTAEVTDRHKYNRNKPLSLATEETKPSELVRCNQRSSPSSWGSL